MSKKCLIQYGWMPQNAEHIGGDLGDVEPGSLRFLGFDNKPQMFDGTWSWEHGAWCWEHAVLHQERAETDVIITNGRAAVGGEVNFVRGICRFERYHTTITAMGEDFFVLCDGRCDETMTATAPMSAFHWLEGLVQKGRWFQVLLLIFSVCTSWKGVAAGALDSFHELRRSLKSAIVKANCSLSMVWAPIFLLFLAFDV